MLTWEEPVIKGLSSPYQAPYSRMKTGTLLPEGTSISTKTELKSSQKAYKVLMELLSYNRVSPATIISYKKVNRWVSLWGIKQPVEDTTKPAISNTMLLRKCIVLKMVSQISPRPLLPTTKAWYPMGNKPIPACLNS